MALPPAGCGHDSKHRSQRVLLGGACVRRSVCAGEGGASTSLPQDRRDVCVRACVWAAGSCPTAGRFALPPSPAAPSPPPAAGDTPLYICSISEKARLGAGSVLTAAVPAGGGGSSAPSQRVKWD